jgi:hypothetical protein
VNTATVLFGPGKATMADGHIQISLPARSGLLVELQTQTH